MRGFRNRRKEKDRALFWALLLVSILTQQTWQHLIRNAESWAQPCTYWNRIDIFTRFPGNLFVHSSFRSTDLVLNVHFGQFKSLWWLWTLYFEEFLYEFTWNRFRDKYNISEILLTFPKVTFQKPEPS